jgi:hypothetical protein
LRECLKRRVFNPSFAGVASPGVMTLYKAGPPF